MAFASILPVAAGALRWPWWTILIFGAGNVFGHLMDSPATVGHLRTRDGLMLAVVLEFAWSVAACAALFALGRLLRLI